HFAESERDGILAAFNEFLRPVDWVHHPYAAVPSPALAPPRSITRSISSREGTLPSTASDSGSETRDQMASRSSGSARNAVADSSPTKLSFGKWLWMAWTRVGDT